MSDTTKEMHPIQTNDAPNRICRDITEVAYEVYCEMYGPQPALMDLKGRNCRGGFGVGELIAFLYAHSFPRSEWSKRAKEAIRGNGEQTMTIDPIALADGALARKVYKTIEESWRATAPQRQALLESEIIPDELWYKTWC